MACKTLPMHISPTTGKPLPRDMPRTKTSASRPSLAGKDGTKSRTSGCSLASTVDYFHNGRKARSTAEPRRFSLPVRGHAAG